MITSIELGDLLSHKDTKLEFDEGVTVFVGDNGTGKSSIIDALTFALFGRHTRKSVKSLIRRGSNQGFTKVEFSIRDKQYDATRKIDGKGGLAAVFSEVTKDGRREIAAGERKQFGESMTSEIEKIIGLDFEKLKIASIVQQGELNAIIDAKPKEFKELINAIIGIDKLDVASESMKIVNKKFREKIRDEIGYDDTQIKTLLQSLEQYQKEIKESKPKKSQLEAEQERLQSEVEELRKKIEVEAPKKEKINQMEARKNELVSYARKAVQVIQDEIRKDEHKISKCKDCFGHANMKEGLEVEIKKIEEAINDTQRKIQELGNRSVSLKERQELASKLQLKDNRCPVCDSRVEKLNPLFQEEHLKEEMNSVLTEIDSKEGEGYEYEQKRREFSKKIQDARDAETTLRAYSIGSEDELKKIQRDVEIKKQNMEKIPVFTNKNLLEISQIDSHTKTIFENISRLEEETRGFDETEFLNLKRLADQKQRDLSQTFRQIGAISEKISKCEEQAKTIQEKVAELEIVKEYVKKLDGIQKNIFNREGPVATSLRSWALDAIASKASEYLIHLNTKIQRIALAEKTRDISISCHSKTEVLELESLSGGEKVSVALSLRLGMASLLGASNLNLMVLDEPTAHLDAERKKLLVGVLSGLSDIKNAGMPMQFLIITHDAEIFEDSSVEKIYKFEASEQGSKVIAL